MIVLSAAALQGLALAWVRWVVLLGVQPLLRIGVGLQWWSTAGVFALVLALGDATLAGAPAAPVETAALLFALGAEALLGLTLGVCLSLGAHAVLGASNVSAMLLRIPLGPWVALVASMVLVAAFELGLHHAALQSSAALQQVFAVGDGRAWLSDASTLSSRLPLWLAGMTVLALALATPALLVGAAVEVAGAAIARGPGAAPALAQAFVATARLGAVLIALGASWAIDLPRWAQPALPSVDAGVDRLSPAGP